MSSALRIKVIQVPCRTCGKLHPTRVEYRLTERHGYLEAIKAAVKEAQTRVGVCQP